MPDTTKDDAQAMPSDQPRSNHNGPGSASSPTRQNTAHLGGENTMFQPSDESSLRIAQQLVADLEGQRRREAQAYAQGYADGHRSGWEIGYAHAHEEIRRMWAALAEWARRLVRVPTHAELEQRRAVEPGRVDYTGGPIDWETGRPLRRSA